MHASSAVFNIRRNLYTMSRHSVDSRDSFLYMQDCRIAIILLFCKLFYCNLLISTISLVCQSATQCQISRFDTLNRQILPIILEKQIATRDVILIYVPRLHHVYYSAYSTIKNIYDIVLYVCRITEIKCHP